MSGLIPLLFVSIAHLSQTAEVDSAAYYFDLARQAALENRVAEATQYFYDALEYPLPDSFLTRLYWDMRDIMTPEEAAAWETTPDKGLFLARFWRRRDPTPATPENERLAEHFQRLAEARKKYSSPVDPRGYDDRGMIYVRYGPPDDVYLDPGGEATLPNESWAYHRLGDVTFDFIEFGGSYRLEPDLRRAIVEEATTTRRLWQLMKLFEERSELGVSYQRAHADLQLLAENPELQGMPTSLRHRFNQVLDDFVDQVENQRKQLPQAAPSFKVEATPLFYTVAAATFRGRENTTRLEIYYGLPLSELKSETSNGQGDRVLESYINVMTPSYDPLFSDKQVMTLDPEAIEKGLSYVGQFTTFLRPDTYRVAIELISPSTRQRGHFVLNLPLPDYHSRRLAVSDIELASQVRPATEDESRPGFVKHGLWVEPYPYRAVAAKQPLMMYYEIYGLTPEKDGQTRYRVEYEVRSRAPRKGVSRILSAINPFGGRKAAISTSFDLVGDSPDSYEYLALDLSTLKPDSYELVLQVTDQVSGRKARSALRFRVIEMPE